MDEDFGFDSGFDDVGSADLDIDSGFDDTSLDTDLSLDDIGSDDILGDDLGSSDLSLDTMDDFDSFEDIESSDLDTTLAEEDFLTETDDGLDLTDADVGADDITDLSVENDSLELDDFSDDVDTLESDDISSLTELDEDDIVESVSEDEVTVDDMVEEDIITDIEDDGYFENIPNEMEPFVMEEAQTETTAETEDLVPEFDEEFPETHENTIETDISEVSELPDETVPDEEVTVEGSDAPVGDKTPYEAMRDYMYEHNYGQMDYPEYSQDPEWQALNEQYTASLEETPVTEDTTEDSSDHAWDIPDTDELQELQGGDAVDIQSENDIVDSDIPEAFEESTDVVPEETGETEEVTEEDALDAAGVDVPEGDKTPYEAMRDYMYEHNYGQMDYPEYSQDPEWQALNEQYTASLEETPAAYELASEDLEQAESEATDTVITDGMAVDTAEVIPETAPESTGDMPEFTDTEDMLDVESDEEITETAETPEIEELHELTDAECDEIYEPWDGERLSEGFEDIDIATYPERLDSTLNDFVESNWENLSLDEQKQSMQSLADCVVDTVGFKNPPAIEFYNNPSEGDYGGYDSSTNTLSVNEFMLYDSNEAADTIAHELWHAHQHECAMDPQSTRDLQYQFNFDNYIPPEDGMEDYQAQLIEAEARAFAEQFKDRLTQLRGRK